MSDPVFSVVQIDDLRDRFSPLRKPLAAKTRGGVDLSVIDAHIMGDGNVHLVLVRQHPHLISPTQIVLECASVLTFWHCSGALCMIGAGREFDFIRGVARSAGYAEQTVMMSMRLRLWGYDPAPPGTYIIDPLQPVQAAASVLKYLRQGLIDIPLMHTPMFIQFLEELAAHGVPPHDCPPGHNRPFN